MHNPVCLLVAALLLLPALLAEPVDSLDAVPSFPLLNLTPFRDGGAVNATPVDYQPAATPQELLRLRADAHGYGVKAEATAETTYLVFTSDDLLVLFLFAGVLAVCLVAVRRFGG